MNNSHQRLVITGAAGYVGGMLADQFSKRPDVEKIICIDKELRPELLQDSEKIIWITANTSDFNWQEKAREHAPTIVINCAWQIRELYGKRDLEWKWNIDGSDNVFDFAFSTPSVKRLIHFSTVASYGAFSDNTVTHHFVESEPFRKSGYLYAEEKRISEEHLEERYARAREQGSAVSVFIVRPAAITGPRGRYARIRFGLQSALSGSLKSQKSFLYSLISLWVSWVPVTPKWLRQYIHEDDVTDIVATLSFNDMPYSYEAFNIAPPGPSVFGKDMAEAVHKKTIKIHPWMAAFAFFVMWHLTRGRIPTAPGSWRGYSYPIAVDGSKLTRLTGYQYTWQSKEAFQKIVGRYASIVKNAK